MAEPTIIAENADANITSDKKVKAKIDYEKTRTVAEVVAEADFIFEDYKKRIRQFRKENHLPPKFTDKLSLEQDVILTAEKDRLLKMYQGKHKEFTEAYPLVLRMMIQLGEYNSTVYHRYLEYIAAHPYKTDKEYFESNGEYTKALYRHYHPRATADELAFVRQRTEKMLAEEKKTFEEDYKKISDNIDEIHARAIAEKRKLLANRIKTVNTN